MKVAFFSSFNDKGISNYSDRLISSIHAVDPSIDIIRVGIKDIFSIHFNIRQYFNARRLYTKLGEEMNQGNIAHIQHEYSLFCNWVNPFENMYALFRKQITVPVVITVHEIVERKIVNGGSIKTRLKYLFKRFFYILFSGYMQYIETGMFNECAAVIVHTKQSKERLEERGVSPSKIRVIAHAIPELTYSSRGALEDKKTYGLENKFVLTTYGLISERKGQDVVIEILDKLPEHVVYMIAGRALDEKVFREYEKQLHHMIKDKHLIDRVIFTGFVPDEDVKYIMNATDIIVAPARDITASGSISEAIAYQKPILGSNVGFIREINEQIECIHTFKTGDPQDLLMQLRYLLDSPEVLGTYQYREQEYARTNSPQRAAEMTIDCYNEILSHLR